VLLNEVAVTEVLVVECVAFVAVELLLEVGEGGELDGMVVDGIWIFPLDIRLNAFFCAAGGSLALIVRCCEVFELRRPDLSC
jgi:hypothetical protein